MSASEHRGDMERNAIFAQVLKRRHFHTMIEGSERGADSERNTYRTLADPLSLFTVSSMLVLYTCVLLYAST